MNMRGLFTLPSKEPETTVKLAKGKNLESALCTMHNRLPGGLRLNSFAVRGTAVSPLMRRGGFWLIVTLRRNSMTNRDKRHHRTLTKQRHPFKTGRIVIAWEGKISVECQEQS
jgi:hypothetical protein